jgi:hypothetical protein
VDPEAAYYQTIEESFVSLRGDPLFLSNADWVLVREWRTEGIPLRIVLRGIRDALDSHAHSWGRQRKVKGLAYCAPEVAAAHQRWQRAVATGAQHHPSPGEALRGFASALEQARGLGPAGQAKAREVAEALRRREGEGGDLRTLDPWLQAQEAQLLESLCQDLASPALGAVEAAVDADLAPYRERMPAKVLGAIRTESVARRLLEAHGLPRLSLFHLAP